MLMSTLNEHANVAQNAQLLSVIRDELLRETNELGKKYPYGWDIKPNRSLHYMITQQRCWAFSEAHISSFNCKTKINGNKLSQ